MKTTINSRCLLFILAVVICFFAQESAFSQNQLFGPQQQITGGAVTHANSIRSGDLNNDSLPDVICNSFTDVVWYKNIGEGKFDFQKTAFIGLTGPNLSKILSVNADFDGDGDLDIAYFPTSNRELAWQENDGTGNFDSIHVISSEFVVSSVCSSDFDNDGDMDLLGHNGHQLLLILNDTAGNFSPPQILVSENTGKWVTGTADVDGDGDVDILVSYAKSGGGKSVFYWIENEGGGSFGTEHFIADSAVHLLHVDDMDGDGDPDFLCAYGGIFDFGQHELKWFENDGAGIFWSAHIIDTLDDAYYDICTADFDNDGDPDILSCTQIHYGIFMYENAGNGSFGEMQTISNVQWSESLNTDDLDGDGYADFFVTFYDSVVWYKNQKDNTFADPKLLTTKTKGAQVVCTADLDGDGDQDIISASTEAPGPGGKFAWYENTGYHTFGPQRIIYRTKKSSGEVSMLAFDADNDTDQDVFSGYWLSTTSILLHTNSGLGTFDSPKQVGEFGEIYDLASADLNGDGKIDLLVGDYNGVKWNKNLGHGNFSSDLWIEMFSDYYKKVFPCDLDGDQDIDVLYSGKMTKVLAYSKNDGQGNFSDWMEIYYGASPLDIYAIDLTNDGKNDIIAAFEDQVVWFENLGGGLFSEKQIIVDFSGYILALYSADANNDGFADIFYSCCDSIYWHQNLGNGNFGKRRLITSKVEGAFSIVLSDIDDDGDLDLFSASKNDGKIAWYENLLITTSLNESSKSLEQVAVYPNPATNWFNLRSPILENESATVEIFDLYGRLVQSIEVPKEQSNVNIRVDQLQKGIYIVRLNGSQSHSCKLIKN